jgi:hypothetical protein
MFIVPLSSPMSAVKCADSAFPIYRHQYGALLGCFAAYISLIKRVEQEQKCKEREQQAVELQERSPV